MKKMNKFTINCNDNKSILSIKSNCQVKSNAASESESCCQVEINQCENDKENNGQCEIQIICDCESTCC